MKPVLNKILVEVDMEQKDIDGGLMTAKAYNVNYRDRRPVLCTVTVGNSNVKKGTKLLAHHNFFYEESPFRVQGNLFSIYTNENIFARIDDNGEPHSMFGNVMTNRIPIVGQLEVPPEHQKMYEDRLLVIDDGEGFKKGQVILCRTYGWYEIIYNWEGKERRVHKIFRDDIVGKLKPRK